MPEQKDTLTHLDERGNVRMVDVGDKKATVRIAVAKGFISMAKSTLDAIVEDMLPKGDVLATARIAAIMAAKKTPELIPMCHPLLLTKVDVELIPVYGEGREEDVEEERFGIAIEATAKVNGQTGVEMEALTAVSVAALTIYDMCKAIDRGMVIERAYLEYKSGGASGEYKREATGQ